MSCKHLTSYLGKPEYHINELMKKASKEAYNKNVKYKMWCICNVFMIKQLSVSMHGAIQIVLSMCMRHSNNFVYIPTDVKKIEYMLSLKR